MQYEVVLPAAGSGKRMGAGQNKLFLKLLEKPILVHTLEVFQQDPACTGIWLAVKPEERGFIQKMLEDYRITKVKGLPDGGAERQHSVHSCMKEMQQVDIVLVHDAARPFITHDIIAKLVQNAHHHGAAIAGVRAKDTMKKVSMNGIIEETVDRESLWMVQTPQAFRFELIMEAEDVAEKVGFLGTDEAMLMERLGHQVHIVESSYENVKMTTQEDLVFGEAILRKRGSFNH
ncbi:2-C-methyl-D-erythritol 4-phosphate cytidylyltransferase [Lysinibacillus capsici]|jgi:2-C-methyl-D-erythritol 4-phosphate cytidylyltransferase|uniref:2-C-methyl-D-erythritol 4-phosphate cytidylyltransferase n=1 Tax=Lysinibacillus capsici TaxID=2115968 RepID=A0ABY8KBQ5_9BACI|nr:MULTISPECIES: 2-C-methyl-D-erythritol 4-phosphate cytidylyltransferase [Lysinibacillus]AUS88844.1 2-C-methyl-D-erythritol 4-phosphate cytidylyltransferase [Lysinibacillus sp. YS11]KMN36834.1 2-C-methyl-D-erythritol 4-phosphate cytidylyltransferase [Lysinibacillus sp. LK3]MCR6524649.1 2-C-methyl-D-erythritol 4-phosphate cytidylyltransferase [Lysinibacillus capsici]MCS5502856.1 2-C-methyl-D-erythritol 4-phosphate cytidylyltransferase [Lysinibacillus sp. A4]MCT1540530.1 2-C-methyl-D-erythritol